MQRLVRPQYLVEPQYIAGCFEGGEQSGYFTGWSAQ
jgi:hypothetical protein